MRLKEMKTLEVARFHVNLSFACNMNCSYCYVKDRLDSRTMSSEARKRIVDVGRKMVSYYGTKKIQVSFLGGEPFLRIPELLKMVKDFRDLPCDIHPWVFTNGSILDDDILKELRDQSIFVILSSNELSEDSILKNCDTLSKYQKVVRVSSVLNEKTIFSMPRLVTRLYKSGYYIMVRCENEAFRSTRFLSVYPSIMKSCFDAIVQAKSDPKRFPYMFESLDPRVTDRKSVYLPGRSLLVFDPDSAVRPLSCSGNTLSFGTVLNDVDFIHIMNSTPEKRVNIPRWSMLGIPKCEACDVGNVCQGGNPTPKFAAYGRFDLPSPYCEGLKELIPYYVKSYRRLNVE
jgi:sulfatase maturation enzyme AslB (radical SAM superfamily)